MANKEQKGSKETKIPDLYVELTDDGHVLLGGKTETEFYGVIDLQTMQGKRISEQDYNQLHRNVIL